MRKKRERNVQDAVPVEGIYRNGVIRNKLGGLAVVLEISPVGMGLLDQEGRKALLRNYHQFLLRLPGPVFLQARDVTPDLTAYLHVLREETQRVTSPELHAVGMELYGTVHALLAGQSVREKRFYLIVPWNRPDTSSLIGLFRPRSNGRPSARMEALLQQVRDLAAHLSGFGLSARICGPEEVLNLMRATYDASRPPVSLSQIGREVVTTSEEEE